MAPIVRWRSADGRTPIAFFSDPDGDVLTRA
jgi:hypothetical protein